MERIDDLRWRKSSYSGNGGDCVEVGHVGDGMILVRDSKDREGSKLAVGEQAWSAFVQGIKHGEFDL
jgi:hypothetical protein